MQQWLALLGFAFVTAFTPGPNNAMLMISGANFGFARSVPHMLGVSIGFPVMVLAVGLGLGGVLEAYPLVHRILAYVAFAYLVYLAWKLAFAGRVDGEGIRVGKPMSFVAAALFQWVNPKAWIMAVSALALYVPPNEAALTSSSRVALAFALAAFPSTVVWCLFGKAISHYLDSDRRIAIFNGTMAVLLVVSMVPTLL
ncbi:Threonine/homoserine/homoserine lactone efflux protein [Kaistia soli DSM 19436]|uniref:Threonine/homoserine/homoserine lactone efflux protein n=1 Tax=Kaistia soli DSM 19436 TaxID=1122133 RepID=A0A1M5GUR6_9HYPH|nr:LysE family translocator [Kaistia soli]SHG07182.1 Threonine/homoserine/homoserine lactone efflux protein [Kaistia soli DSM 19436]